MPIAAGHTPRYSCSLSHVRVELGIGDHVDDPAVLHHVVPVRDGGREAEILLDQQDRETLLLQLARSCAPICWTITGARPSVGSSSSSSARRCAGCGRSRASAARRPTVSCPGSCAAPQIREQLVDLLDRQAAVAHLRRQHQVLLDVEAREDAALLGTPRDAEPGDAVRRQARSVSLPVERIEPSRSARCP